MDPRPLLLPKLMSRGLEAAWRAGLARRPPLEASAIVAAAGPPPADGAWRERLEALCAALREEARLNSLGRTIAFGQLARIVAARARAEQLWAARPDIRQRALGPALIVIGQMRSGTTRIHRLLACDPGFAHTRTFETLEPVPPRGLDLRRVKAVAGLGLIAACNPALRAVHPTSAAAPEEEFGLHAYSLWGAQFEGQWHVPSFARLCEESDARPVYAEFADLVRTIGWARGDPQGKAVLLKAPQFAQDMAALTAAFPGAMLVRLHRDPAEIEASSASLAWQQARVQSDHADRAAIGREWRRKTRLREARMTAFLEGWQGPLLELDYRQVGADWRGAMRMVYARLGRPLKPAVEARMARFVERSGAHKGHRYRAEDFGLSPSTT